MNATDIKKHLNKQVRYKNQKTGVDKPYMLTGAIFRKNADGFYYQAELQDLQNNRSIVICSLNDIEPIEQ